MLVGFGDGIRSSGNLIIPNTKVFLRAADAGTLTLVSNKASVWADQSGNGNDASQVTAGLRPTFNASSVGGKPGLTGTASTVMNFANGLFTAGQERWCFAIIKAPANTGTDTGGVVFATRTAAPINNIAANSINTGGAFLPYSNGVDHVSQVDPDPTYQFDGNGHAFEWHTKVGDPPGFVVDGVAKTTIAYAGIGDGTVTTDDGGSAAAFLMNYFAGDGGLIGDLCEFRAGTGAIAAPDLSALRAYVTSFYGIAT